MRHCPPLLFAGASDCRCSEPVHLLLAFSQKQSSCVDMRTLQNACAQLLLKVSASGFPSAKLHLLPSKVWAISNVKLIKSSLVKSALLWCFCGASAKLLPKHRGPVSKTCPRNLLLSFFSLMLLQLVLGVRAVARLLVLEFTTCPAANAVSSQICKCGSRLVTASK